MNTRVSTDPRKPSMKPVYIGAIIVGVAWLIILIVTLVVFFGTCDATAARWGQFGDAFGTANALFTGLALVGAIAAIILQGRQLGLQAAEIESQRRDLAEATAAQRETATLQRRSAALQGLQTRVTVAAEMLRAWEVKKQLLEAAQPGRTTGAATQEQHKEHNAKVERLSADRDALLQELTACLDELRGVNRPEGGARG